MKMKENTRLDERKNTGRKKSKKNYKQQKCRAVRWVRNDTTQEQHGSLVSDNSRPPH